MGKWMYRSTCSWPRHNLEANSQLHTPATLPPGEKALTTHCIGGWAGPRTGLDNVKKRKILPLKGLELRPLGRPARNQSLYRVRETKSLGRWTRHRDFLTKSWTSLDFRLSQRWLLSVSKDVRASSFGSRLAKFRSNIQPPSKQRWKFNVFGKGGKS
jgi:hypothetical protein